MATGFLFHCWSICAHLEWKRVKQDVLSIQQNSGPMMLILIFNSYCLTDDNKSNFQTAMSMKHISRLAGQYGRKKYKSKVKPSNVAIFWLNTTLKPFQLLSLIYAPFSFWFISTCIAYLTPKSYLRVNKITSSVDMCAMHTMELKTNHRIYRYVKWFQFWSILISEILLFCKI